MAISSVSSNGSIESVLAQMRQMRQMAKTGDPGQVTAPVAESSNVSFSGTLKQSLARISEAQNNAQGQARDFELGKPGVALNDVMIDLQKASIGFQMGVQVRNKVVAAYQEVMNMTP